MAANASSLSLFWDLASASQDKRLESSSLLVSTLAAQQAALVATTSRTTLDDAQGNERRDDEARANGSDEAAVAAQKVESRLDQTLASEVSYSLRRLLRGLASPREQSRVGFAVALTELLATLSSVDAVTAGDVLILIRKYSSPSGKVSRSEERNLLFARLFGIQSLLRSGLLLRHTSSNIQHVESAISELVEVGQKKAWLRESTGWVMAELLEAATTYCADKALAAQVVEVVSNLATSGDLTSEKIVLLLRMSNGSNSSARHPSLHKGDVLSSANLPAVAKVLRNASVAPQGEEDEGNDAKGKDATGAHNPRAHFVWDAIVSAYTAQSDKAKGRASFVEFWRIAVDESLFHASASPERKSWGFQVFCKALPALAESEKPLLFTPNFMRTWINQLAGQDRLLHSTAAKAAETVQSTVKEAPRAGFALVSQLLGKHGSQNFDRLTGTKTIEGLLSAMDAQGVKEYVQWTVELIATSSEDSKRRWGLDQLLTLVRNTAVPTDDECIRDILQYLCATGFFEWKKGVTKDGGALGLLKQEPKPAFSDASRGLARSRLFSCLTELIERTTTVVSGTNQTKGRRAQGVDSQGRPWLSIGWDLLQSLAKRTSCFSPVTPDSVQQAASAGAPLLEKVQKHKSGNAERSAAFESLVVASLLYVHDSPEDEGSAEELLEQLQDCHERLFSTGKKQASKESEEELSGIELLLDFFVGLLERPSAFLRAVVEQTFTVFVGEMNAESLDHLIDQLGLNEEPTGEGQEDDGESGDEQMDADQQDDADDNEDDSETSADSVEDDEDDDDDDGEVDDELRGAVLEALKAAGMADEGDDDDSDDAQELDAVKAAAADAQGTKNSDYEDEVASLPDLSDEQMLQVDDRLAEIFRSRLQSRKDNKIAQEESIAFQNRILDLLAIFAKRRSTAPEVLRLVRPLFMLATESGDSDSVNSKTVTSKAATMLRNSVCKAKETPVNVEVLDVIEDLEAIHGFARRTASTELASLANVVNVYLTRVCHGANLDILPSRGSSDLVKLYKETLDDYLHRKTSQLKPAFLIDSLRRFSGLSWELREPLLESCSLTQSASIKTFRQQQAMQMLGTMLNAKAQASAQNKNGSAALLTFLPQVSDMLWKSLDAAATSSVDASVNASLVKELLKFALQAVRVTKRVCADGQAVQATWDPVKIQEAMKGLSQSARFAQSGALQGLLKQMLAVVEGGGGGGSGSGGKKENKKRKAEGEMGATAATKAVNQKTASKVNGQASESEQKKPKVKKAKVNANGKASGKKQ